MSLRFKDLMYLVMTNGNPVSPRGMHTMELENGAVMFPRPEDTWCTLPSRRLSPKYIATEFLWYLRADPTDLSIAMHARIWRELINVGQLQSNYGVYLFKEGQLLRAARELQNDPDSRRAVVLILRDTHFYTGSADIPCTYALGFRLRDKRLNMSVHMRSNDIWFGLGNDAPIFSMTQHMMAALLGVEVGSYFHVADSMHLYARHYESARACLEEEPTPPPIIPKMTADDVHAMINDPITPRGRFHEWITEMSNADSAQG